MVKRFFNYFQKEIGGLHQAAYLLALFAILADILGLLRDRSLAYFFGAGHELDIYYAAFRIPDFIFVAVASIVSLSVLIPLLSEHLEKGHARGKEFINTVFSFFIIVMITTCIVAFIFIPFVIKIIFPGFQDYSQLILLTRVLLLSPIFLGISNLFGTITQTYKRFFVYATSPILYNVGILFGILVLRPAFGLSGIVTGVALGALMHLLIQIPSVAELKLLPSFQTKLNFKEIREIVGMSLPRTIALSVSQVAIIFLLSIASIMKEGSIAVFNFSYNLETVPLSIIGVSYSLAAFPTLSKLFAQGEHKKFLENIITSARHIIFWSMPATIYFIILRAYIVRVLLGSGKFSWADTRLTAAALGLFMISAVFQGLVLLFVRGYYSMGKTSKPLVVNIISGVVIVGASYFSAALFYTHPTFQYFIESLFKVSDIPGTAVLMLALGFTIGSILNGVVLWLLFEQDFRGFSKPLLKTFFHTFASSVIGGAITYYSLPFFTMFVNNQKFFGLLFQSVSSGLLGLVVTVIILKLLKNQELEEIWEAFHKKFWKSTPISPETHLTS